ncbi:Uncharacterised protein [Salmonella enterica subsp. enterica serovar Typhi]|uniref:Uncharacterized protein n=1 Tax=Escherichia coli TaxID=562 RepID=A0A377F4J0_ECOLX|nr:Uncharacterised protein [Salmonella enterica subsp. enterica serovar Typhi]STN24912.1 Uncharacterised protein [Escherichia coli]CGS29163.1 Uncharacterised protein [Salmonella enterica subsp. enterica serovar Typhi]CGS82650.1 Uncharacterised protein [Salmonella enterica subsp. enterica serovar Typhi]CGS89418.1 Uncharacterised protein [Salmonella enterica subsp. enterica serovar Typhi]
MDSLGYHERAKDRFTSIQPINYKFIHAAKVYKFWKLHY